MNKILFFISLTLPSFLFANQDQFTLNAWGVGFMGFAWISILTWNIICFSKILSDKNNK